MFNKKIQAVSEIDIFRFIGEYAISIGYDVVYFKSQVPKFNLEKEDIELVYMHYIHILKDEDLKVSIYYDEHNAGSMFPECPYYEIYDMVDVERFIADGNGEIELFDKAKLLLKEKCNV